MDRFLQLLQNIDRRIIYSLVLLLAIIPFFVAIPLPISPSPPVLNLYNTVEKIAEENARGNKEKIVLLQFDWDASVQAENWPQSQAMIEHLMQRNVKFAILGFVPQGPTLGESIAGEVAQKYGKKYGEDWVNWGYKSSETTALRAMVKDLYSIIDKDIHGTPMKEVAMMRNVSGLQDIGLVFEVTGSGGWEPWVAFVRPEVGTPVSTGVTAIIGPDVYPFLDSKQVVGMMEGLSGAAQYETLVKAPAKATRGMGSQNLAHFLIIGLIILGNVGYLLSRKG